LLRRAEDQEDAYFALLFGMMAVAGGKRDLHQKGDS